MTPQEFKVLLDGYEGDTVLPEDICKAAGQLLRPILDREGACDGMTSLEVKTLQEILDFFESFA